MASPVCRPNKPTPIDRPLELRGRVKEIKGRKVVVAVDLFAHDEL